MNIPTSSSFVFPPQPTDGSRRLLLTPLPEPGEFLLVLDNSSAEKFVTCPRAAQNYLVHGREAHARNAALVFGGAIHSGLEQLLLGRNLESGVAAILRHFTEHPAPPDEYRTVQTACEVLLHYQTRASFPDYHWNLLSDAKGPLVERAFELPLGVIDIGEHIHMPWLSPEQLRTCQNEFASAGDDFVFCSRIHVAWSGRMDAIAHCNGANRVIDHKTTSIAGDQVIQDFHLSNQTIGYVWAAQQLYPDLNVSGFCVNFIHLKKPGKGQGLMDKGIRGGEPPLNFFRHYFNYSPQRLSDWAENALTIVSDFVHCLTRNYFPMHTKWCFGKYGACPYHLSCVEDNPTVRHNILMSDMFKAVTWNPTADR